MDSRQASGNSKRQADEEGCGTHGSDGAQAEDENIGDTAPGRFQAGQDEKHKGSATCQAMDGSHYVGLEPEERLTRSGQTSVAMFPWADSGNEEIKEVIDSGALMVSMLHRFGMGVEVPVLLVLMLMAVEVDTPVAESPKYLGTEEDQHHPHCEFKK